MTRSALNIMRRFTKLMVISACFLLILPGAALANTCDNFGSFTCPTNTKGKTLNVPHMVNLIETGSTGQSGGILLGSDKFGINVNGQSVVGDELVIVAAFPNGMGGKVDGVSFSSLGSFAEDGAIDL